MHLYAKLYAHLGRMVHCTLFCAFLLGLYFPRARGGMWCCNHISRGFVYSSLGDAKNLLSLTGEYFSFSFPAHSFRAYMLQWPEEEMWCSNATTCQEDSILAAWGHTQNLLLLTGVYFAFSFPCAFLLGHFCNSQRRNVVLQPHVKRIRL